VSHIATPSAMTPLLDQRSESQPRGIPIVAKNSPKAMPFNKPISRVNYVPNRSTTDRTMVLIRNATSPQLRRLGTLSTFDIHTTLAYVILLMCGLPMPINSNGRLLS
jgi:hypothetical protein